MDEEAGGRLRLRRSSALATVALLLLLLALPTAWWTVTNELGGASTTESVGLLSGTGGLAHGSWVLACLVAAMMPVPVLFVRVAARSWRHEPAAWRRDLALSAVAVGAAAAMAWLWPVEGPFWGTRVFPFGEGGAGGAGGTGEAGGGEALTVVHAPGAGWWFVAMAFALLAWAWAWTRPPRGSTTDK